MTEARPHEQPQTPLAGGIQHEVLPQDNDAKLQELINSQEELLKVTAEHSPAIKGVSLLASASETFVNRVRANNMLATTSSEEKIEFQHALMVGRFQKTTSEEGAKDLAGYMTITETSYFAETADVISRFHESEAQVDIDSLLPKDYTKLIDTYAAARLPQFKEVPKFGEKEHDVEVIGFLSTVNTLATLAFASGSPAVASRVARAYDSMLRGYPKPKADEAPVGADARIYQEAHELIQGGKVTLAELETNKPLLGSAWPEVRNKYLASTIIRDAKDTLGVLGVVGQNRSGAEKQVQQELTGAVRERLKIQQEINEVVEEEIRRAENETPVEPTETVTQATLDALLEELPIEERLGFVPFRDNELEGMAEKIIDNANTQRYTTLIGKTLRIDPERIKYLATLKRAWEHEHGEGSALFMRGELKGQRTVNVDGRIFFDEYIFLDLRKKPDENSEAVSCGVVADSPVAGQNAAFIFRNDTEPSKGYDWQDVFKLRKLQTRVFGARAIKHIAPQGEDPNEHARDKLFNLMFVEPDHFYEHDHRRIERATILARGAGYTALRGAMEE